MADKGKKSISADEGLKKGVQVPADNQGSSKATGITGSIGLNNKKESIGDCNLLGEEITKKTFPFTPLIPLIICLTIFIFTAISAETVATAANNTSPQPTLILLLIGFIIVFFSSFFTHRDNTPGKYYDRVIKQAKNPLIKTLVTIESLLTSSIQKIQCTVLYRWVEYYNYPFNYIIFSGALVICCIVLLAHLQSALHKYGPDDLSPGSEEASTTNKRVKHFLASGGDAIKKAWGNVIYTFSFFGVLFTIFTNYHIVKMLDEDDKTIYIDPAKPKETIKFGRGGGAAIAEEVKKGMKLSTLKRTHWIFKIIIWAIGIVGTLTAFYNLKAYHTEISKNLYV
tara:strand:- start:6941 stop:7960 length:1020 start_codon:yes stop_codon:yes gene_type:complete